MSPATHRVAESQEGVPKEGSQGTRVECSTRGFDTVDRGPILFEDSRNLAVFGPDSIDTSPHIGELGSKMITRLPRLLRRVAVFAFWGYDPSSQERGSGPKFALVRRFPHPRRPHACCLVLA